MQENPVELRKIDDAIEALKNTFRHHASGVAVITMLDKTGNPVGFTATSVTSLGANPPLASFNVASGSSTWPALCEATWVSIHTLGENNQPLAEKMATDHTKRFLGDDWQIGPKGLPIFPECSSILIAGVREIHSVENNAVVIVDVVDGLVGVEQRPLIYFQRGYLIG